MNEKRKLIARTVRERNGTITVYGTPKYCDLVKTDRMQFQRCGIRKAESLFMERYFMMLEYPMRKKNPEEAQRMYLAGELNWRGYIAYAEPCRTK